ncbi:BspA family leucine-rich repeat surface protein [Lentilactobacillus otakiensis]|nr:BspA family leucine-rich repeat surface protein [Lentilactobacillus otakiensis]MBZ3777309.1 BspA family leucine-rich repeat surface protein [Lentilactobacillus otakiensis]
MNKVGRTLLLLAASAGASFVLIGTQVSTTASANIGQSLLTTKSVAKVPALRASSVGDPKWSGQIDDVSWNITDGVLTISGGTINSRPGPYPWDSENVTKIDITGPLVLRNDAPEDFFFGLQNVQSIEGLSNLDLSDATSVKEMFGGRTNIQNIDWSQLKTGNLTTTEHMFYDSGFTHLDLSGMDTHSVTDMSQMFSSSEASEIDLGNIDTSNVRDMSGMFSSDRALTKVDLGNIDTKNVTDMSLMFSQDSALTNLDFSKYPNFVTSNVHDMNGMFVEDRRLTSLNVSTFETGSVLDMSYMFAGDMALTSLNLQNWDTKNVTSMQAMFVRDPTLTSLDLSNFNTSNVEDMNRMFSENPGLTFLDISHFNTSKVTNMHDMFSLDQNLPSLNVSSFDTSNVTDVGEMFLGDVKLTSLDLSSFDLSKVNVMTGMLSFTHSLQRLTLGENTFLTTRLSGAPVTASLGVPAGGDQWQAVASGTIANPAGAKFTPDALMALYTPDQTRPAKETYVVPGQTDKSAFTLVTTTIPVGGTFDPAKVFVSATTPEGTPVTNWNDAIGAGLTVTGADFDTNNPGQYKVTFKFAGSDKIGTVIVTVGNGGGGGGSVTPPAPNPTPTPTPNPVPTPTPQPTPPINPETPTIPGNVAKKKHAVYALKAIYLYKNPTFKKGQRMTAYPKQKRINRPMFVVIGYGRSSNGTLRYKVRDVNHNRKSAGKVGFITANWKFVRGAYYQSVPKNKTITVISKKGVKAYKHQNLTGRLKFYKKGTRLTVKKIVTHNLTTRYLLSNGTYVTANKKLVIQGKY